MTTKSSAKTCYGYDGLGYTVGDRVELHPGCDLWVQGARYGTVTAVFAGKPHIRLDKLPTKILRVAEDRLRRIE